MDKIDENDTFMRYFMRQMNGERMPYVLVAYRMRIDEYNNRLMISKLKGSIIFEMNLMYVHLLLIIDRAIREQYNFIKILPHDMLKELNASILINDPAVDFPRLPELVKGSLEKTAKTAKPVPKKKMKNEAMLIRVTTAAIAYSPLGPKWFKPPTPSSFTAPTVTTQANVPVQHQTVPSQPLMGQTVLQAMLQAPSRTMPNGVQATPPQEVYHSMMHHGQANIMMNQEPDQYQNQIYSILSQHQNNQTLLHQEIQTLNTASQVTAQAQAQAAAQTLAMPEIPTQVLTPAQAYAKAQTQARLQAFDRAKAQAEAQAQAQVEAQAQAEAMVHAQAQAQAQVFAQFQAQVWAEVEAKAKDQDQIEANAQNQGQNKYPAGLSPEMIQYFDFLKETFNRPSPSNSE